jgi:hypothetical protein
LIQPRFISEEDIFVIKHIAASFFESFEIPNHRIDVVFNTFLPEETISENYSVMIGDVEDKILLNLQKSLLSVLGDYTNYCDPKTKIYEQRFRPHITIGSDLDRQTYTKALDELGNQFSYKGSVSEIVLSIVNEDTVEESKKLEDMIVFKL